MHEFAIAQGIRDIALDEARRHGLQRVIAVHCRVGVIRQVVPEMLRTAFELSVRGTPLEQARLLTETEPIDMSCLVCEARTAAQELLEMCPACGSNRIEYSGGQDISVISLTVGDEEDSAGEYPRSSERPREEPHHSSRDPVPAR